MKVANIIVVHKNPRQALKLIQQYDGSMFHNFVHIDPKCDIREWKEVIELPTVTVLGKRRRMVYTGWGFVQVTLDALRQIQRETTVHYFYINLISGMDFPVRRTRDFFDFLKHSYETDQREYFEILDLSVWPGTHRYQRYHLINWTIRGRYLTERIINKFIAPRQFYKGKFVPYGRASWFTATDKFVAYALRYFDQNPDYLHFLKSCWCPDEFIFNTLIMNSPFRNKIAPYLRYIDWSEGKVTPRVFRTGDEEILVNSGAFMARKFDEAVDAAILTNLEKQISTRV